MRYIAVARPHTFPRPFDFRGRRAGSLGFIIIIVLIVACRHYFCLLSPGFGGVDFEKVTVWLLVLNTFRGGRTSSPDRDISGPTCIISQREQAPPPSMDSSRQHPNPHPSSPAWRRLLLHSPYTIRCVPDRPTEQ